MVLQEEVEVHRQEVEAGVEVQHRVVEGEVGVQNREVEEEEEAGEQQHLRGEEVEAHNLLVEVVEEEAVEEGQSALHHREGEVEEVAQERRQKGWMLREENQVGRLQLGFGRIQSP